MTNLPRAPRDLSPGERCRDFLTARLTEELALLWDRARPGLPAQVAVLDDLLTTLARGDLPATGDLRILFSAYGNHDDYDPRWTRLVGTRTADRGTA